MARVSRDKFEKVRPKRRLRSEADSKSRETNEEVTEVSRELRERQTPPLPLPIFCENGEGIQGEGIAFHQFRILLRTLHLAFYAAYGVVSGLNCTISPAERDGVEALTT